MSSSEEVNHLQIPLQELSYATNGFSGRNLLARGGFGNVYNGVSGKHGNIVIKMLDPGQDQGDDKFRTEVALLSSYKHENIVSLLGFCDEDEQKILVYKHESKGSLNKHLRNPDLTWIQRLQICLDAARGLQYLHDDRRTIHHDVKSSNILLDKNWKAKIDSTSLISNVWGTMGYIDPEYAETGLLTKESDVYSFGVVLFEVMCGRLARHRAYTVNEPQSLTTLIKTHWGRKTLDPIIFPILRNQINRASLLTFATIAYQCLMSRDKRPTMKKVVEQLQKALDKQLPSSGLWSNFEKKEEKKYEKKEEKKDQCYLSPSRISWKWKYDVFISFRGEDTRKTFVDHLFSNLEYRQIFTYKDDELLPRGEPIGPFLFKAIKKSRIAIIVFSQNYASSSWCLDELAFIMKNMEKRGQTVIPIFYGVEPSEVRKQRSYYRKALALHELNKRKEVESWREALVKAGNLAGWEPRAMANGHEAKAIKTICDDISQKLLRLMARTEASAEVSANIDLIGLDTRMQDFRSLLELGSGEVLMAGICGTWGSGKSTLASSIYENISHEFEGCCFVENVRAESRMHGLKTLQEKILSNVLKSKVSLWSIQQGISMMTTRLSQNSVLIVLDDVDHMDHLKMLAGSKNWFGNGSRIIFTTRNQDLLNAYNVVTHNVRLLDDTEAIELFSRRAFGKSKPVKGFKKVSRKMVSKFGGHPSALISVGSSLHDKDMSEWISILDRLEAIPVNEILEELKIRDDGVESEISDRLITYLRKLECRHHNVKRHASSTWVDSSASRGGGRRSR